MHETNPTIGVSNSPETKELIAALVEFQAECPVPPKDGVGKIKGVNKKTGQSYEYEYFYTKFETLKEVTREPMRKHGLAITQGLEFFHSPFDGHLHYLMATVLMHKSGQWYKMYWPLSIGERPQETGSNYTYARRYSYQGILGLVSEDDDDGAHGSTNETKPKTPTPPKQVANTPNKPVVPPKTAAPKQPDAKAPPPSSKKPELLRTTIPDRAPESIEDLKDFKFATDIKAEWQTKGMKLFDFYHNHRVKALQYLQGCKKLQAEGKAHPADIAMLELAGFEKWYYDAEPTPKATN